ncbi:GatB/YqeY domain-containing protein [Endomicrobium proavitum]|uniref:GatB/Yqey family protein n=1 Tax=Endomicrobium proavitum TaxID=1408281 RepID=A0A0G3WKJ8_9BACT|nr:GatB/YqeY domain-containing protein [Endomicrobium proavitum]AKL97974.1 GatB/Yqey family protein [Endomicrobium proavitum]
MINKLKEDLKIYMKAQDIEKLNVVRGILNEINIRDMKNIKITDDEILKVLRSELKKRKESIESFEKGGRQDLIDKEKREIDVINKYLPSEITDDDLFAKVKAAADASADKSFGVVMKAAIAALNGAADGKRISAAVKKVLENK